MKIENTASVPLAVFHIGAGGERTSQLLAPGQSLSLELEPGDSVKTRIATEITDPVEPAAAADVTSKEA